MTIGSGIAIAGVCPPEVLDALSRLNVHARAFGCGKSSIYAYKTFVACEFATEARAVEIGVKCHHCNGTSIYSDWDGHQRGQCWRCTKGIAVLKFVESRIGDYRWHHPMNGTGVHYILDNAWNVASWRWPDDGPSIATLTDGTERKLTYEPPGDWGPNMPAEKLPADDLAGLLNVVEAWLPDVERMRPRGRWLWERAVKAIRQYQINLDRVSETTCCWCGEETPEHRHRGSSGYLTFARPVCVTCQGPPIKWPKSPHPDTMTPNVLAWLAHPMRRGKFEPERDYDWH